jgi:hypothetical protein
MKKIIALILTLTVALGFVGAPVYAEGDTGIDVGNDQACKNWKGPKDDNYNLICGSDAKTGEKNAQAEVKSILNTVFIWLGIISVAVMIIGGVLYMISQGDPGKIVRAKNAIMFAAIGLVVSLLAFAIVNFILDFKNY